MSGGSAVYDYACFLFFFYFLPFPVPLASRFLSIFLGRFGSTVRNYWITVISVLFDY